MRYVNANDVLPVDLLFAIQTYYQDGYLYITVCKVFVSCAAMVFHMSRNGILISFFPIPLSCGFWRAEKVHRRRIPSFKDWRQYGHGH